MKKAILIFCFIAVYSLCFGEVYVIVDKTNKDILTLSEKNDTVLADNQELFTLPGTFETYPLDDSATNYKYDKGKFIKNIKKINDAETARLEKEENEAERLLIEKEERNLAIKALTTRNITLKYYKEEY